MSYILGYVLSMVIIAWGFHSFMSIIDCYNRRPKDQPDKEKLDE